MHIVSGSVRSSIHLIARLVGLALLTAGAVACDDDSDLGSLPAIDPAAPVVRITSPTRGAYVGNVSSVTVTGQVTDGSALRSLRLNGQEIAFDVEGNFSAVMPVSPTGTALFTAEATDVDGHVGRVTQALSAGPRALSSVGLPDAINFQLSEALFQALGTEIIKVLNRDDLDLRIAPLNPVIDSGTGCLRADVNLGGIDLEGSTVQVRPTARGVEVVTEWNGVNIPLRVAYSVACINGVSSSVLTSERVRLTTAFDVIARDGRIELVALPPQVEFYGLQLIVPGLPPVILSLLDLSNALRPVLGNVMQLLARPVLADLLGGLTGDAELPVLGAVVDVEVSASEVLFSQTSALLHLDAVFQPQGAPAIPIVSIPSVAQTLTGLGDLAIAVTDDAVNSLAAGAWAATGGALRAELPADLEDAFDRLDVREHLPISVAPDGTLHLVVPEVSMNLDRDGKVGAEIVVNGMIPIAVDQDAQGRLQLMAGTPELNLDVVSVQVPLTRAQLSAITDAAVAVVGDLADAVLGAVPLPAVSGAVLTNVQAVGRTGSILISGRVP